MANVKVFADKQTDNADKRTGQKNSMPPVYQSGGIKNF